MSFKKCLGYFLPHLAKKLQTGMFGNIPSLIPRKAFLFTDRCLSLISSKIYGCYPLLFVISFQERAEFWCSFSEQLNLSACYYYIKDLVVQNGLLHCFVQIFSLMRLFSPQIMLCHRHSCLCLHCLQNKCTEQPLQARS